MPRSTLMMAREPVKEVRLFQLQDYLLKDFRTHAGQFITSLGSVVILPK